MSVLVSALVSEFKDFISIASGDLNTRISEPSSQVAPIKDSIVFVSDPKLLSDVAKSQAAVIVTTPALAPQLSGSQKTVLQTKNVYWAMAKVNSHFFPKSFLKAPFAQSNIAATASIHAEAEVSESAVIGPGAVIHAGVRIGSRTVVGANTVIENFSVVGDDCMIAPNVVIGHHVRIGHRCEIKAGSVVGSDGFGYAPGGPNGLHQKIPHYGELIIEDDVSIGALCAIDRGTYEPSRIGAGTKIDNLCHFGHNAQIGKNCLITAAFSSAGSIKVGDNCVFGGRSSINGKVELTDGVTIAPLSGVTNDIEKPGVYGGYPPIEFKEFLKVQASLSSLPRLRKNVAKIMKQLGLAE